MIRKHPQIISIMNKSWYIETQTGLDDPFDSEQEAASYLNKELNTDPKPMEFAGLQFTSQN